MSDVRIVSSAEATKRDGIVGVQGVIRAEDQEREIRRNAAPTRPLSPAEARLAESGQLPEAVGANPAMGQRVIPTVKTDEDVYKEAHRAVTEDRSAQAERIAATAAASAVESLRDDFHRHAAKVQKIAEAAKGDPAREASAVAQVAATVQLGEALQAQGVVV